MKKFFTVAFLFLMTSESAFGQRLIKEELLDSILPSFSIYKDNYFLSGVPTNAEISEQSADIKYQISFKQLITRNSLPFNSLLFLTYTQKAFWNVYALSSPFQEVNFNPGIGIGTLLFDEEREVSGVVELMIEHESNGRDSIYSRSWNSVSLAYHTRLAPAILMSFQASIPFAYKKDNPDLMKYFGYAAINLNADLHSRLILDVNTRKGSEWDWKGSLRARLQYRLSKSTNQYIMLEWFKGYGESLIDYDKYTNMIRFGYIIKSPDLSSLKRKRVSRNE